MWECWGHPSCSKPPPSPPPRIEQQERPGWRSRVGCSETNPEWYHSAVSQRPTPVPKRHQRGSAALRTLHPIRAVLPRAPGAFPWDRSGPGCAGRCCPSACSLGIQTQEKRNQGWADRPTSARRGRGRRGHSRHSRQRPGDTRQSHGDTLRFPGTPPLGPPGSVPFLPSRRLRGRDCWPCPNPSGAGSRSPVRVRDSSPRGCPARAALGGCAGVLVCHPQPRASHWRNSMCPPYGKRSGVLLGGRLCPLCHSSRATLSSRAGGASRPSPPAPPCTLEKDTMVWRSIRTSTHSLILLLPRRDPAETGSKDGE